MQTSSEEREKFLSIIFIYVCIDGCWEWKGAKFRNGYGRIYFRGKNVPVHRLAYAVFNGDFDDDLCVLHKCDVKLCFNPKHLFLGTNADNSEDMVVKGRQKKGEKHPMFGRTGEKSPMFGKGHFLIGLQAGEKNGNAKLQERQVLEILAKHKSGLSRREIAKDYSVSNDTIKDIILSKTWKHVPRL